MNLFERIRISSGLNSVLLIVAGALLIKNPVAITKLMISIGGLMMVGSGIFDIARYFSTRGYAFMGGSLIFGVLKAVSGLYVYSHAAFLIRFFSYVVGLFVLVCGINSLENAFRLKFEEVPGWMFSIIMACIVVFASITMMFRPFSAVSTTVTLTGVVLVVEGLADLFALYRMKDYY